MITNDYLDKYDISDKQPPIEDLLQELESKASSNTIDLTSHNALGESDNLPLIGSLDHALDLASRWAQISKLRFHEVDLAL